MKEEKESKKYIWIQHNNVLSYDNENCYLNDQKVSKSNEGQSTQNLCNSKQQDFYNILLKKHFRNLVILTAAGTSMDSGGKMRVQLWDEDCKDEIESIKNKIRALENQPFYKNKDIEGLLSHLILYEKLNGEIKHENKNLKQELEKKIVESCKKIKLNDKSPHEEFLNKITARKPSDPRVKLFTLNYDLLFEQAANKAGFTIIDGFSFTQPRIFSGKYFDLDIVNREKTRIKHEESFESKVFHLYKLHGSLNWHKVQGNKIEQIDQTKDPLIIYPANEKYESSYEQPYFEMMSRFQQSLRKENTLLIVIGFGFQDKHIQNVISEAVDQNPSFNLIIINYNKDEKGIKTDNLKEFFLNKDEKLVKRNVVISYDSFSDFVKKYPSNNTYLEEENNRGNDETI